MEDHVKPYDREELYRKVWEKPLLKVAEEYGISAVALGKTLPQAISASSMTRVLGEAGPWPRRHEEASPAKARQGCRYR